MKCFGYRICLALQEYLSFEINPFYFRGEAAPENERNEHCVQEKQSSPFNRKMSIYHCVPRPELAFSHGASNFPAQFTQHLNNSYRKPGISLHKPEKQDIPPWPQLLTSGQVSVGNTQVYTTYIPTWNIYIDRYVLYMFLINVSNWNRALPKLV